MHIIGKYEEKPNAYEIGKSHEDWAFSAIKYNSNNEIVHKWIKGINQDMECLEVIPRKPESHIEKSDFFISLKLKKQNGLKKIIYEGVSAKSGITTMWGQIYRGSIESVLKQEFIPTIGELYEQHKEWLSERKSLSLIKNLNTKIWEQWYGEKWNKIIEDSLFGNKTFASSLLLSNLNYNFIKNELEVLETVMVNKKQVLEDMKILSDANNVKVNLDGYGDIGSGIIKIQRAGGSNGEKGAEDWQVRLDRFAYIKWIKENRPKSVWFL